MIKIIHVEDSPMKTNSKVTLAVGASVTSEKLIQNICLWIQMNFYPSPDRPAMISLLRT
jgi:hypothetical protein